MRSNFWETFSVRAEIAHGRRLQRFLDTIRTRMNYLLSPCATGRKKKKKKIRPIGNCDPCFCFLLYCLQVCPKCCNGQIIHCAWQTPKTGAESTTLPLYLSHSSQTPKVPCVLGNSYVKQFLVFKKREDCFLDVFCFQQFFKPL